MNKERKETGIAIKKKERNQCIAQNRVTVQEPTVQERKTNSTTHNVKSTIEKNEITEEIKEGHVAQNEESSNEIPKQVKTFFVILHFLLFAFYGLTLRNTCILL